jgi:hypothetical protein
MQYWWGRATQEQVARDLARAADPAASDTELSRLHLTDLAVWHAVAHRPRCSRRLRDVLIEAAGEGPSRFSGTDGDSLPAGLVPAAADRTADRTEVWACTILSAQWLTTRRLLSLIGPLCRHGAAQRPVLATLLAHRSCTWEVAGAYLDRGASPTSTRVGLLAELRRRPVGAAFARIAEHWLTQVGSYGQSLRELGAVLDQLDEDSATALAAILPGWTRSLDAAVLAARDLTDRPDPKLLAEHFPAHCYDRAVRERALAYAEDPQTHVEQLRVLPLDDLAVWEAVAAHPNLDAPLRAALVRYALGRRLAAGPEVATRSAAIVLGPAWLTPHRLAAIAAHVATAGPHDPQVVLAALARHRRPLRAACAYLAALPAHRRREVTDTSALEALEQMPAPWPTLAGLTRRMLAERRSSTASSWAAVLPVDGFGRRLGDPDLAAAEPVLAALLEHTGDVDAIAAIVRWASRGHPALDPVA